MDERTGRRAERALVVAFVLLASCSAPARAEDEVASESTLGRARALAAAGRHAEAATAARDALVEAESTAGPDSLAAAQALDELVTALHSDGHGTEPATRAAAARAVAIKEKALGPDHPDVARGLSHLGSLLQAAADLSAARPLHERALAIREKALGPEHPDVAESLADLASLLKAEGDLSGARPLFERALAIREKALGPDHRVVAMSLNDLALLLVDAGDLSGPRPLLERSLAIREKALGPDHPDVATSLNNLAFLLRTTHDLAGARPLFERALAIKENAQGPDHPDVATSLNNLALVLQAEGDLSGARPLYERSLAIKEKALGPDHPDVASTLHNVAFLLQEAGDLSGARPLYERSIVIKEKALGLDHLAVTATLNNLGRLLQATGDLAGARPLFERSIAIREKALGPDHPDVAGSLINLARLLQADGDLNGARPLAERSLAIREKALGPDHPGVATALTNVASLFEAAGDLRGARPLYERAVTIWEKALGPDHADVARSLNNLAGVLAALGESPRALELALRAEDIGREHARRTLRSLSERQALAHAAARPSALNVLLSVAASGVDGRSRAKAWDALVRSRAFVLDDLAGRHRTAADAGRLARTAAGVATASQRLANLSVRGVGTLSAEAHQALLTEATKELEQAERALAEQSASFREEGTRAAVGFDEIARSLAPGEALVAYSRYRRVFVATTPAPGVAASKAVPSYVAFVLRGGEREPQVVPLGPAADLDSLVERWREEAARPRSSGAGAASSEAGSALRRVAWDPVAAHLKNARRVLVVPDGALHVVNLAVLPAEGGGYLVESGPLLHLLSAERDRVPVGGSSKSGEGLLALGGATFDARTLFASLSGPAARAQVADERVAALTGPVAEVASLLPLRGERSRCPGLEELRFTSLPASAVEAREVATLWESRTLVAEPDRAATILAADGASEAAFKARAPGRRVLHVATHGFFLGGKCESALDQGRGVTTAEPAGAGRPGGSAGESPLLLSGLALAGANQRAAAGATEEDGILTAQEVASLDLAGVEWAVLSACGTGLGDVRAGEGVLGLERAFRVAGAQAVIMSLWSVDDEATRQWMRELYEARWQRKLDTATCVRDASLAVLRDRRGRGLDDSPFWWGAFVASGDSR